MKKKELVWQQKMFAVTLILMITIFLILILVNGLKQYSSFFENISSYVVNIGIISEIILFIILIISIGLSRANGYQFTANISLEKASKKFNDAFEKMNLKHSKSLKQMKGDLPILEVAIWIIYTLAIFAFPIGYFLMTISINDYLKSCSVLLIFFLIGLPVVVLKLQKEKKAKYIEYFKENCIKEFFENLDYDYSVSAPEGKDIELKEIFNLAGCDSREANFVKTGDYIAKTIKDKKIELTEAYFSGSFGGEEVRLFDGLFGYIKLNSYFNNQIRIQNADLYENNDLSRVELNNYEFERIFKVYSEDKIAVSRMLTEDVRKMLVEFYNKYLISFEINISKDLLTIKFYTGKMFEPTIVGETLDKKVFYAYYAITEFAIEMADKLRILEKYQ